ncbi:isopeptide-forming domain-containing fimbrial protein [Ruminococcus sp. Marseille-P6503]|uniref:isopeptide-forming domain-containing fimbrial protein n=1 Tax=Ruminococcus sp. Marseille-P6503 TaxID=2364796 RepID=UPI0013DDDF1E|nr:isopeptide-forming domain-containing fimbrial protein [Ruminococcus sp. Marseille-P6503]
MNLVKKFAGMAAAAIVAVSMVTASVSFTAFASSEPTTYTITIQGSSASHTYDVYQIFTGNLEGDTLKLITWGSDVNGDALLAELKSTSDSALTGKFTSCSNAADVATVIGTFADDSDAAFAFAAVAAKHVTDPSGNVSEGSSLDGLGAGYYLIRDNTVPTTDAYSKLMLKVAGDITVTPKSAVPTVVKKVNEESYTADDTYGEGYNDVADWDIGDNVPFKLIGTLPSRLADYETYKYIFHDTLSSGLTYNSDAKVYLVNGDSRTEITDRFTIQNSGNTLTATCNDVKAIDSVTASSQIVVEYTAKLNTSAVIGKAGNPNEVYLEFSNQPDASGAGDNNTGSTPADKVIVFTYELDTVKVDGSDNATKLKDAKFTLQRSSDNMYVQVGADGKVTGWTSEAAQATVLTSDENGLFKVIGIEDGEYILTETDAPEGYNKLTSPITVTLTATTAEGQNWDGTSDALTSLTVKAGEEDGVASADTGIAQITVANNTGAELPSTGGIGTTIFYVSGGALVLGSGVLLIVKKRMKNRAN